MRTTPLRVLVVEDEPVNRALLRAVLETSVDAGVGPVAVVESETLAAARTAVDRQKPDVIILDVRLPDGNGLELARELAQAAESERPRVIVMSASVLPVDRDAAARSGSDAFLAKPYLPADLVALLVSLCGDARAAPETP